MGIVIKLVSKNASDNRNTTDIVELESVVIKKITALVQQTEDPLPSTILFNFADAGCSMGC